jgi:hypothetical protein
MSATTIEASFALVLVRRRLESAVLSDLENPMPINRSMKSSHTPAGLAISSEDTFHKILCRRLGNFAFQANACRIL